MNGSRTAAEAWHCESPEKVYRQSAARVAVNGPGLKSSWRKAEAWHNDENPGDTIG